MKHNVGDMQEEATRRHYESTCDDLQEERLSMGAPHDKYIKMYCDEVEDRSIATRKARDAEELRRLGPVGA